MASGSVGGGEKAPSPIRVGPRWLSAAEAALGGVELQEPGGRSQAGRRRRRGRGWLSGDGVRKNKRWGK